MTSPASDSLKEIVARLDQRIRSVDEERWLSSRYAVQTVRDVLIVLYAFYYELARVRVAVTDATLGNIRFQWWRDALDELTREQVRQHDVVIAMSDLLNANKLRVSNLQRMIDEHEKAFLQADRFVEPEHLLLSEASHVIGAEDLIDDPLRDLARQWAALRRGAPANPTKPRRIPAALRPVAAHFRLRHAWSKGKDLSPFQSRASVLYAMLTGKI
ncbi:MAG: squalene/phytoene synthase family protein [Henriciella sp.]